MAEKENMRYAFKDEVKRTACLVKSICNLKEKNPSEYEKNEIFITWQQLLS